MNTTETAFRPRDVLLTMRGDYLSPGSGGSEWAMKNRPVILRWYLDEGDDNATVGALHDATVEEIAEACFEATNHPAPESLTGLARTIAGRLGEQRQNMRSLSVNDTVRVMVANADWSGWYGMEDNGQDMWTERGTVRCRPWGWEPAPGR